MFTCRKKKKNPDHDVDTQVQANTLIASVSVSSLNCRMMFRDCYDPPVLVITGKPGRWERTIWRSFCRPFRSNTRLHGGSSLWSDQGSGKQNAGVSATTCPESVYANCPKVYRKCVCVCVFFYSAAAFAPQQSLRWLHKNELVADQRACLPRAPFTQRLSHNTWRGL